MDLTISLSPDEASRLRAKARKRGLQLAEFVKHLVVEQLPEKPNDNPTLALFQQWKAEDSNMTAEEIEAEKRLWANFEQGINEARQAMQMRIL